METLIIMATEHTEPIIDFLEGLANSELMHLHNIYCESNNDMDSQIYYNDEDFFDTYFAKSSDLVRAIEYGEHSYSDEFVQFNGYAVLAFSYRWSVNARNNYILRFHTSTCNVNIIYPHRNCSPTAVSAPTSVSAQVGLL